MFLPLSLLMVFNINMSYSKNQDYYDREETQSMNILKLILKIFGQAGSDDFQKCDDTNCKKLHEKTACVDFSEGVDFQTLSTKYDMTWNRPGLCGEKGGCHCLKLVITSPNVEMGNDYSNDHLNVEKKKKGRRSSRKKCSRKECNSWNKCKKKKCDHCLKKCIKVRRVARKSSRNGLKLWRPAPRDEQILKKWPEQIFE